MRKFVIAIMTATAVTLSMVTVGQSQSCTASDFPHNLTGWQVSGLSKGPGHSSPSECLQYCCQQGPKCQVYQFSYRSGTHDYGECWVGKYSNSGLFPGPYISYGRGDIPPPPPPPPPPTPPPPPPQGPYTVDDTVGLGMRWEGVGAISGGGATTKLLMDYPKDVVSDILDFMFLPNFGLDLDILKVEMGGDTDSTEGAEPSHMHGGPGDEDYNRGYEWWLMKEAKARKPNIQLYGLPWGWPGWLDPTATADKEASNAFANPNITANYTLAWLLGAKRVHGLSIDYMGQWNERDAPSAYADALRAAVAASELAGTTTVLNRLPHYPGTGNTMAPGGCKQNEWNSTDGRYWVDEEGSIYDGRSARCLARCINRNYVSGCHTATFQWHLITSFYDYLPWDRCGVAIANEPWSGHYEITSPTWAIAHTTQFADPGWRYTAHDSGVTLLEKGGSMVTRIAPDLSDFSIVIEKMTHGNSECARGENADMEISTEKVVLMLKGNILKLAQQKGLHVWRSNMSSSNSIGSNPADDQVFQLQSDKLPVGTDGSIAITVSSEELYTITTLGGGRKGTPKLPIPENTAFPIPFNQPFDDENISAPPALWYDQMGAWEVQQDSTKGGHLMRQVSPVWPACWGYSCSGPLTYFGPSSFNASDNITISIDVMLEDHGTWSLTAGKNTAGVALNTNGTFSVHIGKTQHTGPVAFSVATWHNVKLAFSHAEGTTTLAVSVNDAVTTTVASDGAFDGWYIAMGLDRYIYAAVDNFAITK